MKTLVLALFMVLTVTLSPIATAATHMGAESPDLHVTLVYAPSVTPSLCTTGDDGSGIAKSFFRLLPNGARQTSPYVIPAGYGLIVTDIDWVASTIADNTTAEGDVISVYMYLQGLSTGAAHNYVFQSTVTLDNAIPELTPPRSRGRSEHLTTGFVVGSGIEICAFVTFTPPQRFPPKFEGLILHGYLSPVPKPSRHN
jgi:hypothetical protein